jgi:hypothetical protein
MSYAPAAPGFPAPAAPPPRRHALGLPAGSVRALLALGVLGLLWALALNYRYAGGPPLADRHLPLAFIYLQFLMVLILAHFFAAHGSTIGRRATGGPSPLGLPSGSIRFLLLAGYLGLAVFLFYMQPQFEVPPTGAYILLLLLLLSGFTLGHLIGGLMRLVGGGQAPDWFQDFEAWLSLVGLIGLTILLMVHVFINTSVSEQYRLELPNVEAGLAAVIGFYFGARS